MAAFAWDLVPAWRGRTLAAATLYLTGPKLYPRAGDLIAWGTDGGLDG